MIIDSKLDILAFGAHPDDVEIGAGGFIAKECALGYKVGIVDLTRGDMSTRGTVEERAHESDAASAVLGLTFRANLGMKDRHIQISEEFMDPVVRLMRLHKPNIVLAPYWLDRHPDHMRCSELITESHFNSGLRKFLPEIEAFRPSFLFYYYINKAENPAFICDVSDYYEIKKASVLAHESQFLGSFPYSLESRDRYFGAQIRKQFGEGFASKNVLPIPDPAALWGSTV